MCFNSKTSRHEKESRSCCRLTPATAALMMFIVTTINFIAELVYNIAILKHNRNAWIYVALYLASDAVILIAYGITRWLRLWKKTTEITLFLMVWALFALRYAARLWYEESPEEQLSYFGNILADLAFLAVSCFVIEGVTVRILHMMGTFAVVLTPIVLNESSTNYFVIIQSLSAFIYAFILVIYNEVSRTRAYSRSSGIYHEIKRIANLASIGSVLIDSNNKIIHSFK